MQYSKIWEITPLSSALNSLSAKLPIIYTDILNWHDMKESQEENLQGNTTFVAVE